MDELRLEGVHDDGEHLVLQDTAGTRHLLRVDQQLRQAVQRARRTPARRPRQGAEFGPRDIQARFRSGATLEDIVEESGWEPERVRRYEWPILAERGHMARQAQKVELGTRTEGYRSAFEGGPLSLAQTVETRASDLGIAPTSFDWDAWQRPDLLWTVTARFRLVDPARAPQALVDQQPVAQWIFNPATLSVASEPGWAQPLTGDQQRQARPADGVFGEIEPVPAGSGGAAEASPESGSPAAGQPSHETAPVAPSPATQSPTSRSTEQLLDVLDARRGQRLGSDEASDDQLAEILGRGMGHLESRPRPISAPQDSSIFEHPVQPSHAAASREAGPESGQPASPPPPDRPEPAHGPEEATASGPTDGPETTQGAAEGAGASEAEPPPVDADRPPRSAGPTEPTDLTEPTDPTHHHEATIHHLGRADDREQPSTPVVEITDDDETAGRPLAAPTPISAAARFQPGDDESRSATRPAPEQDSPADSARSAETSPQDSAERNGPGGAAAEQQHGEPAGSDAAEAPAAAKPAEDTENGEDDPPRRPRPRNRTGSTKRTRSSVPSWDDIVFGSKTD